MEFGETFTATPAQHTNPSRLSVSYFNTGAIKKYALEEVNKIDTAFKQCRLDL